MGQIDKKLKNQLFKVAVDYIYKEHLVGSQGELAKKIGISDSALSRIMNDKKFVGDDTLRKMNESFGGIFNMAYFRGDDPHCMLAKDLAYYQQHPEERLNFDKPTNEKPQSEPVPLSANDSTLIMSKMFESMLKPIEAAHAQTVASLNQQIADKNHYIAGLEKSKERLAAANDRLQSENDSLKSRIDYLEGILRNNGYQYQDWPFPTGVADKSAAKSTNV